MCTACFSRLNDFKQFHDECLENDKIWEKFNSDDASDRSATIEYLEEYIEDVTVDSLPKIESVETKNELKVVKTKKKKGTVALESDFKHTQTVLDEMEKEDEQIRKFYDLQCQKCVPRVRSNTFNEYKTHLKNVHNDQRPSLICCGKKLSKRMDMIDHMNFHLNPDKLKCPQCQRVYSDRKNLKSHILQLHGTTEQKPFQCEPCGKR